MIEILTTFKELAIYERCHIVPTAGLLTGMDEGQIWQKYTQYTAMGEHFNKSILVHPDQAVRRINAPVVIIGANDD